MTVCGWIVRAYCRLEPPPVDLPNEDLTAQDQELLALLVVARSVKMTIWLKISRYHDATNPLRESRRRGGKLLLGGSVTFPGPLCPF